MIDLVGHFLVFGAVAVVLLAIPLLIGKFVRPNLPTDEKEAVYERGEPTIGSSYIQFDLRFYVVALLFIIFDVEVAFFFPWAVIYGEATQLADVRLSEPTRVALTEKLLNAPPGVVVQPLAAKPAMDSARLTLVDILAFFAILLVGYAYVWKRGDLDWVRAITRKSELPEDYLPPDSGAGIPQRTSVGPTNLAQTNLAQTVP